ncbi:MAG TPA: zinc ABC transporter substrate-binding protein [Solirubrobacteraceae bacterium]|jgi:zinc/manganese transport system substrate-binding protein
MRLLGALAAASAALALGGCDSSGGSGGRPLVVAGENFWGSVAAQLGGDRVRVESIITNPQTDPHSYQPSTEDARTLAEAKMAIVNGIGYDEWESRLLSASPLSGRIVLNVGRLLGLGGGENPHQWYSPEHLDRVVDQIVADYDRLDPSAGAYFAQRKRIFLSKDLAEYDSLRAQIRRRYAGVAVGYSESIFTPLGEDLHLKLLTPYSFAKAIAEGTDVSAKDKRTVDRQAEEHKIAVWVFNSQNVTPDVQRVNEIARAEHIPILTVTETLSPASANFQQWQTAQLRRLLAALSSAAISQPRNSGAPPKG